MKNSNPAISARAAKSWSAMLRVIGVDSLDTLIDETIPASIRMTTPLKLPPPISEYDSFRR